MIQAENITKHFGDILAVDHVSANIKSGSVFGLIGTNGAGKSTFLRILSGIYKPDEGSVIIDEQPVFENTAAKENFFYISDEQFFFPNCTPTALKQYYARFYKNFDCERFDDLLKKFGLNPQRKINTFSKGMKKQISIICALSAKTAYIFCDETFDGLDPVIRQAVKSLFAADIAERNLTPVIASHNLRELEDICDHVGLLHRGGILLSKELDAMKLDIHKIQCIFPEILQQEDFADLSILAWEQRGSLSTVTLRGDKESFLPIFQAKQPIFLEVLPLTLEEIFISETEVAGYDIKSILF